MSQDQLDSIIAAMRNVSSVLTERQRQVAQTGVPPSQFVADSLMREATRLIASEAVQLGDAVLALRSEIEAMDNG